MIHVEKYSQKTYPDLLYIGETLQNKLYFDVGRGRGAIFCFM
jgi:hypothetical protein